MSVKIKKCQEALGSVEGLYWAMVRSKYYLPKKKTSIITEEYMMGVMK